MRGWTTVNDHKLAADAIRESAEWQQRALSAEAKVAHYERKERVEQIQKLAEEKGAVLPAVNLMECDQTTLDKIAGCVELVGPGGTIKLASLEGDASGDTGSPARQESELDRWLKDPTNYSGR